MSRKRKRGGTNKAKNNRSKGKNKFEKKQARKRSNRQYLTTDTFDKDCDLSNVSLGLDMANPIQNSVLKYCKMNSQVGKEMLAVMAALTDTVDSNGSNDKVTAYYAALMTFLETLQDAKDVSNKEETLNACVALIGIFIKRLPEAVLRSEFSNTSKIFIKILQTFGESENMMVLKNTVQCLSDSLRVQEVAVWQNHSTADLFLTILNLAIDPRPKIRKIAQAAVTVVVKTTTVTNNSSKVHPAVDIVAQFCLNELKGYRGSKDSNTLLYVLGILQSVLVYFPQTYVKSICESILTVMSFGDMVLKTRSLQTLHSTFLCRPKSQNFPSSLTAKLITALYDYEPIANADLWLIWLQLMHQAYNHLHSIEEELCFQHLPFLVDKVVNMLTSDSQQQTESIANCLKDILYHMVQPLGERLSSNNPVTQSVITMFGKIENALSFQYHTAWNSILQVITVFYEVAGCYCFDCMASSIRKIAEICENDEFTYVRTAHKAIGTAIQTMGPHFILQIIPLELTEDKMSFHHEWLIPILRNSISGSELKCFINTFLPVANELREKGIAAEKAGNQKDGKCFRLLECQIWSLLPGFCNAPTDLKENFKKIAQILGNNLKTRPELHLNNLSVLRTLITKGNDENKMEMARFAKNYLPILFNLYSTLNDSKDLGIRMAVLETIKVYLTISPSDICESLIEKSQSKWPNATEIEQRSLMDLTCALLPHLNADHLKKIYESFASFTQNKDPAMQKKAFRILEALCSSRTEASRDFVVGNLNMLENVLSRSLSKASPSTKTLKMRCLQHLLNHLSLEQKGFVVSLLPEIIICLREPSTKARASAKDMLNTVGRYFIRVTEGNTALHEYLQLLTIGLASTPTMVSATVAAISHVLQAFAGDVLGDLKPLVESVCILSKSPNREIVRSTLEFFMSLFAKFDNDSLTDVVESIVRTLVTINGDPNQQSRVKTREIFSKLIHRFGIERLRHLVPEKLHKMLHNIVKEQLRQKRKRTLTHKQQNINKVDSQEPLIPNENETDSNDDDDSELQTKYRRMQIRESGEDQTLNFLEASAFKNISAAQLSDEKDFRKKKDDFPISDDGRLLIVDDEENPTPKVAKAAIKQKVGSNSKNKKKMIKKGPKPSFKKAHSKDLKRRKTR